MFGYVSFYVLFILLFFKGSKKAFLPNLLSYFAPVVYWSIFFPNYFSANFSGLLLISLVALLSGILMTDEDSFNSGFGLLILGIIGNLFVLASPLSVTIKISLLDPVFLTVSFLTWEMNKEEYVNSTQTVYYQPPIGYTTNLMKVTFVLRGLPPNCYPVLEICGMKYTVNNYYQGDYVLELTFNCSWRARRVNCNGILYQPKNRSGYANLGDYIVIEYEKAKVITPSVSPKVKNKHNQQIPDCWVGSKISIYEIESIIGEGGTGYVLKGKHSNEEVAIKILKIQKDSNDFFDSLLREASNLIELSNHPNVVRIIAINVDKFLVDEIIKGNKSLYVNNPPFIVTELMRGTIYDLLKDDTFFYSQAWRKNVYRAIKQIAEALSYIHSKGYVHMDVKPQNIFIDRVPSDPSELDYVNFKLGDLGSAVKIGEKPRQLTLEYSPPEALIEKASPSFDVFSLGMTLHVLLTRKMDRPDLKEMEEAFNGELSKVKIAREKLNAWSENLEEIVKKAIRMECSIKDFMTM